MPEVIFSPDSICDLANIWDYVADDSVLQADRLIQRFRLKLDFLAQHNLMGQATA